MDAELLGHAGEGGGDHPLDETPAGDGDGDHGDGGQSAGHADGLAPPSDGGAPPDGEAGGEERADGNDGA
eukprot:10332628-Alexandrium_andersonii.AAC.1